MRYDRRKNSRPLVALLLCLLLTLAANGALFAQVSSRSQYYWQYAASSRLNHVVPADVNGDGVDEFLVLDESGGLALLTADGQQEWSQLYSDPVSAIGAIDVVSVDDEDGSEPGELEVALAGPGYLLLLDVAGEEVWRVPLTEGIDPVKITPYDYQNDGRDEILVLLANGFFYLFDETGQNVWQYTDEASAVADANPQLIVGDFDRDGAEEIVMGAFTSRRYSDLIYLDNETLQWRQAISRRITSLEQIAFFSGEDSIAVGTNFGQLNLYSPDGSLLWFRTVNRPITTLVAIDLIEGPALAVGTSVGSVTAFSAQGQRLWSNNLARNADRSVLGVLPVVRQLATGQAPLVAILESGSPSSELADILLLGDDGQILSKLGDTDRPNVTRLVDVNEDSHYELLLARFATLQLIGLGVGNSEYIDEWEYKLNSEPTAALVLDVDEDGEEEIIVGTSDGRLHNLGLDGTIRWLTAPGEEITFLEPVRHTTEEPPQVVIIRRQRSTSDILEENETITSWLELRKATGERVREIAIPATITALTIDSRPETGNSAILVGSDNGLVSVYDLNGVVVWETTVEGLTGGIRQLVVLDQEGESPSSVLAVGKNDIVRLTPRSGEVSKIPFASYEESIRKVYSITQSGDPELSARLIVFDDNGLVHALSRRGLEIPQSNWPYELSARPVMIDQLRSAVADSLQGNKAAFLVATDDERIVELTVNGNQPAPGWQLSNAGLTQAGTWDDLDDDGRPDISLIGNRDGAIKLYDQIQSTAPRLQFELSLSSGIFDLALLKASPGQSPKFLAITQNGLIRLFREEENRPPLLTHPTTDSEQGQLSLGIQVNDVENDVVSVQLEFRDPITGDWIPDMEQRLENGNGPLLWPAVDVPGESPEVEYRFRFRDGFYQGYVTPPSTARIVPPPTGDRMSLFLMATLGAIVFIGGIAFVRQMQTPAAQAGQFFRRINRDPNNTLTLVEERYASVSGSPDFLLQLANHARRVGDSNLANLADGLFLLGNRSQSGLAIITRTLDDVAAGDKDWHNLQQRRLIYKTCQALLEAPSITELALLRPQFVHLMAVLAEKKEWSPILDLLLPVLTNLRDSERVDSINDRLVYLNQAAYRLRQAQDSLDAFSPSVEQTLAKAIARRWSGLLTAEIEEQRGRAELEVTLKTKRLVPNAQTYVAMEIRNTGRAAAENIIAVIEENPAYIIRTDQQSIPFLPSGRSREVRFIIEPQAEERFRVGLSLTYDDRNQQSKKSAFGDMVHLLPPVREFTPIANPYLPGTPLRKDSPLFFGREELFNFIAEHAGTQTQRNVFMLVGQRRTGKTSLLLRLEDYLPPTLLPVYLDCQSLGVTPGMPALLQEFAWHIADALHARGIHCDVPERAAWQEDPTRLFQRVFLPAVQEALPDDSTVLLVFDEFEAFESMVADAILPRTFFPYMRHLIQHSTGLGFVFVGTRRLEEMSADYWSVLFNIALYRKIDFLSPQATARLICEPVAPYIVYDDLAIDKIWRVTAGHPYFLQLVCYTLVKQANEQKNGYVTISDVNVALDEMLRLGAVHFAYLWQRSNPAERAVLTAAAHLSESTEPLHPEAFAEYLRSYSIELNPTEVTQALNSLVERDIMYEVTEEGKGLYELRIGLVGQWVAQTKSLSRLHVHLGVSEPTPALSVDYRKAL